MENPVLSDHGSIRRRVMCGEPSSIGSRKHQKKGDVWRTQFYRITEASARSQPNRMVFNLPDNDDIYDVNVKKITKKLVLLETLRRKVVFQSTETTFPLRIPR